MMIMIMIMIMIGSNHLQIWELSIIKLSWNDLSSTFSCHSHILLILKSVFYYSSTD